MVSLNQIVSRIQGIADQHYMVKSFAAGDISQLEEKDSINDMLYPRVFLNRLGATSTGGALYYNFELVITDLVQKDRANEQEVISDCMQIATDFVTIMERFEYINESADAFLSPSQTINYNILSEAYSNRVSGAVVSFQIKQGFDYNRCIVPVTSNTGCQSSPTCTDTINSLGSDYYDCVLPSYDFTTSRVQNAVTAQQQTDLIAWLCGACDDATVENSNQSYTNTVAAGGTLVLPNITFTDSDGSTSSVPSVTNITATQCPTASGIAYDRPELTGQTTSYRTGDDGWNLANNIYDYTAPSYPTSYAKLDTVALAPFTTLVDNNAFGNKNRFTDINGLQVYGDNYVIDHLTGLGWYRLEQTAVNWNPAIDNAASSTQNSYSDWRLPNIKEYNSIATFEAGAWNYAPFSLVPTSQWWTSNTSYGVTTAALVVDDIASDRYNVASQAKGSTVREYLLVRNHYT